MGEPGYEQLRGRIASGLARVETLELTGDDLGAIGWSGSRAHLENVARELERVPAGEVEYLAVFVDAQPVCKGGVDFAKEAGAGTIWQVATHPLLEGLGLATILIRELETRVARHGLSRIRLGVEPDNERARRLYEHLGYRAIGESDASWEAERDDGSRFLYTTTIIEMLKLT
jgi:ribosomal protein S18 acetylase RimI-like enzyme